MITARTTALLSAARFAATPTRTARTAKPEQRQVRVTTHDGRLHVNSVQAGASVVLDGPASESDALDITLEAADLLTGLKRITGELVNLEVDRDHDDPRLLILAHDDAERDRSWPVAFEPLNLRPATASDLPGVALGVTTSAELRAVVARVADAVASPNQFLPPLECVQVWREEGRVLLCATDRYRAVEEELVLTSEPQPPAPSDAGAPEDTVLYVDGRLLRKMVKALPPKGAVALTVIGDALHIVHDGVDARDLRLPLVDTTFPKLGKIWERGEGGGQALTGDRAALAVALAGGSACCERNEPVQLVMVPGASVPRVRITGGGEPELRTCGYAPATSTEGFPKIAFNPDLLAPVFAPYGSRRSVTVTLTAGDKSQPMVATRDDLPGWRYLLMPVRLAEDVL